MTGPYKDQVLCFKFESALQVAYSLLNSSARWCAMYFSCSGFSAIFIAGVIPSLVASVKRGERRINPPVSNVIKPLSNALSRFGESSSPFHWSSRSLSVAFFHGLMCDATRRLVSLNPVTAQPLQCSSTLSRKVPCPILDLISAVFSVVVVVGSLMICSRSACTSSLPLLARYAANCDNVALYM